MTPQQQIVADLKWVFGYFPLSCLEHLRDNQHRLTRRAFSTSDNKGCVLYLLSETLEQRIDRKEALTRFFTGGSGHPYCEAPEYQPARFIVRLWDEQYCERYPGVLSLSKETLLAVLDETIAQRRALEKEAARVERRALANLAMPNFS